MTAAEPTKPEPGPAASRSPTVPAPAATPRWYGTDALAITSKSIESRSA